MDGPVKTLWINIHLTLIIWRGLCFCPRPLGVIIPWPACACFLKIISVHTSMYVCVCMCLLHVCLCVRPKDITDLW